MTTSVMDIHYLCEDDCLLDNLLEFDFSDELLTLDSFDSQLLTEPVSSESEYSSVIIAQANKVLKLKPVAKKRGSRFMKKSSGQTKLAAKPVATSTGTRLLKPNMSRRTRDPMLYAFPSFDRCDSLLYFAHSLARHLNSGDIPSVAKLFSSHLSKDCFIQAVKASHNGNHNTCRPALDVPTTLRMYEMHSDIFPDRITCIRSVQVDGNQIKALAFVKFTNSPTIFTGVASTTKEPLFASFFGKDWKTLQRQKIEEDDRSEHEKGELLKLVDAERDMIVHARMEYTLTVDERTRKIKVWKAVMNTTSVVAVDKEEKTTDNDIVAL